MPQTNFNQTWDVNGNLIAEEIIELSDEDVENINTDNRLRQAYSLLNSWANDALTANDLSALTANQRIQRQAQIETRVAALSKTCARLIRLIAGVDQ